ncbi:MAG TPA: amino acid permease [Rhizomicrobium sp.]|jgi:arginine:agmatine antiporter
MSDRKKLGPFLATMVVANTMIGSGIYLLPASLGMVGSISMLAWVAATLGAALICGVFAWLAILSPRTAGLFSYVRDAFGPCAGFVTGVLYWASCVVGAVAIAVALSGYFGVFVPAAAKGAGATISTIAFLWLLIGVNAFGPRVVARLQSWTMLFGLAPVFLLGLGGWFWFHPATFAHSWNVSGMSDLAILPRATVMVFWAFVGMESAIILSVRVRNPLRDVPIGTLGGLAIAAAIYMSASAAIMGILPAATLAKSTAPFADAVAPILGASLAGAVALCALLKASGTLGGAVLCTVETAACESIAGQVRKTAPAAHRVSLANLLFTGVLTSLIVILSASPTLARQFTIVTNVSVVLSLLAYGAASLSLLRLGRVLSPRRRVAASVTAVCAVLFSSALIAVSEPGLLIWTAGAVGLALVAYQPVRLRVANRARALAQA